MEQVAAVAGRTGLTGDALATAVAISGWAGSPSPGESGGNPDALGDVHLATSMWGPSVGLWQIRSLNSQLGTGEVRDANSLSNPDFNARSMYQISSGGTNWTPWSVYTSGAYKANYAVTSKDLGGKSATLVGARFPIPGGGLVGGFEAVVATVSDPGFWRRVGMGALGAGLVIVAAGVIMRDSLAPTVAQAAKVGVAVA